MGLLHTITAAYMITASEASRCVARQSKHLHGPKSCGTKSYGRGNIQLNLRWRKKIKQKNAMNALTISPFFVQKAARQVCEQKC